MSEINGCDKQSGQDIPRTLIAGCGDIGSRLGTLLAQRGHSVWGLRRSSAGLPEQITPVTGDLLDPETLAQIPKKIDYAVFCATPDEVTEAAYRRIYIDALSMFLERLADQQPKVKRLLFVSSTSVYHQQDGEWVDEASATQPTHFRGQTLLQAERLLSNCPWPSLAARCGGIYGPGRNRLVNQVRQGDIQLRDEPPLYTNRIHSDDCAAALAHLISLKNPDNCYLLVDSNPATKQEVVDWIAQRLGIPPPARTKPTPAAKDLSQGKRCSNKRLLESGFNFQYPGYRQGYQPLI